MTSYDFSKNLHCSRIHVLVKNVDCSFDLVVVLLGSKHIDEAERKRIPNRTVLISVVDLPLSSLLVVTNVLKTFLNIGVSSEDCYLHLVM
jgi:hypothetical protein